VTARESGRTWRRVVTGAPLLLLLLTASASAQTSQAPRPPRPSRPSPHAGSWELSGGFLWQGGFDLGDAAAELTRNPTTGTTPLNVFRAGSQLGGGIGLQGRLGVFLTSRLAVEGGVRWTQPTLTIRLTDDVESAANQDAEERLSQYVIDGSAVWHFSGSRPARATPFLAVGAGYIRDMHEGNTFAETGTEYHASGGFKWWFNPARHRLGLRGEVGVSVRDGGFDFKDSVRTVPFGEASLVCLF
jgi:hypothetical protein